MLHIFKHIIRVDNDVKTLDVKILELREDPHNIQLLYDVIAIIYRDYETLINQGKFIKDFDVVNYILACALKIDKIEPENLGIIIDYLSLVDAPSIYF